MGSTNYTSTFIRTAEDCPVAFAEEPPFDSKAPTVAALQYALIAKHPYELTSDDVLFEVHTSRLTVPEHDRVLAGETFFAKPRACLRSSPLGKRYGWGIHHNEDSEIALVPLGSDEYRDLAADPEVKQTTAMRSRRA